MSLQTLKTRVNYMGGDNLGRIKQQKLKSFKAALLNDYNSRTIKTPLGAETQVLINDDNTKSDYDKRYVSADFKDGLQPGDVFYCIDDDTYWMVYLPDLVEIAYFKSEIIRCRYQLEINDKQYHIYFQGPTETTTRWNLKNNINWNDLNFSGTIYIKKDENTLDYFNRFTKLKIEGHTWEVDVVDTITVPGIIELEISEYFDSPTDGLVEVKKTDTSSKDPIIGKHNVDANSTVGYQINAALFNDKDSWKVLNNDKVTIKELQANGLTCVIDIPPDAGNEFDISYGDYSFHVVIAQPMKNIDGKTEVYPYGIYTYTSSIKDGVYSIDNTKAKILDQKDGSCKVEIVSSKKGSFVLTYTVGEEKYSLPIKILSL